jgi:maleate isomerase
MKRRDFIFLGGAGIFGSVTTNTVLNSAPEPNEWQQDGLGALGKIGILTPDFDPVPESEIRAIAPAGISIHSSRVKYTRNNPDSFIEPSNIDEATALLARVNPKAILFGFTSSSYTLGVQGEQQLIQRLEKLTNGIPVIVTCKAATDAFRFFKAKKIALIHPPWFSEEVNSKGRTYFESQGLDVIFCNRLTPARDFTEVAPLEIYQWVRKNVMSNADVIFIGGNGLRTAGAISRLEKEMKKPIVTANQVLLWAALRLLGLTSKVTNYGQIFKKS